MIKTKLCEMLGIKYPIIQAGMGPFSNNQLCIATANAGVLGLLSTSGITSGTKERQNEIYRHYAKTGGADPDDDMETILRKVLRPQLIAAFVGVVATGILLVGWLFNAVL